MLSCLKIKNMVHKTIFIQFQAIRYHKNEWIFGGTSVGDDINKTENCKNKAEAVC